MVKTLGGKIAKLAAVLLAVLLVFGASFAFVGCETKRPVISVRITFNENTYELEYELYRNMYPQTVAHYLELIDMDYFDGTVIHDYQSNRMVGGGYYYDGEDVVEDLAEKDYDAATLNEDGTVALENVSVWADENKETAYNTLYGEFEDNGARVENNGLTNQLGSIGTYYYTPHDNAADKSQKVYVQLNQDSSMDTRPYCYNSVRSMFYLYTGSSGTETAYCTFGLLKDSDDAETFQQLLDDIEEYTLETLNEGDESGTEIFTTEKQVTIEDRYWIEDTYEDVTFKVPRTKIVIEEMRVVKY